MKRAILMGITLVTSMSIQAAASVEYVRICSLYGSGWYYIPGTDTCLFPTTGETRTLKAGDVVQEGETELAYRVSQLENKVHMLMVEEGITE
jgi:hypothetical protein